MEMLFPEGTILLTAKIDNDQQPQQDATAFKSSRQKPQKELCAEGNVSLGVIIRSLGTPSYLTVRSSLTAWSQVSRRTGAGERIQVELRAPRGPLSHELSDRGDPWAGPVTAVSRRAATLSLLITHGPRPGERRRPAI
ncbi:hypothetical protein SKAU_G00365840 [Synaphobranchus kaupii]|uniref:Uncharacterized protein n=1 Tax=Synaphobranchus kaupii TaxID=118154 RepID=A0A9Q1IDB8_SYNKA|nr:hypothetical protein SKAU_G00365840 [Synaphobranchus kaupii]